MGPIDVQGLVDFVRRLTRRLLGARGSRTLPGNAAEPASARTAEPADTRRSAPVAADRDYYTVQPGDTLSKIAWVAYGNASQYPAIFEANRGLLHDQDEVRPGQVLRLPRLGDGDYPTSRPTHGPSGSRTTPPRAAKPQGTSS